MEHGKAPLLSEDYINELLTDAGLVIGYAVRAGVVLNGDLSKARTRVVRDVKGVSAEDLNTLEISLSKGVKEIAPVTLVHLRAGRSPFEHDGHPTKGWKRLVTPQTILFVLAGLLIFCIMLWTEQLHEAQSVLKRLEDLKTADFDSRFATLERKILNGVLRDTKSADYADFRRDTFSMAQMAQEKLQVVADIMKITGDNQPALPVRIKAFLGWSSNDTQPPGGYSAIAQPYSNVTAPTQVEQKPGGNPSADAQIAGPSRARATNPAELAALYKNLIDQNPIGDPCDESTIDGKLKGLNPITDQDWIPLLIKLSYIDVCLSSKLGLTGASSGLAGASGYKTSMGLVQNGAIQQSALPQLYVVSKIEEIVYLYTTWILPMFYGALGSIVFLMRNLQNVRTPALSLPDTLFRIALGAIAGIVVGWFLSPNDKMAQITPVPFALAFITGFSIDLLFSTLDRASAALKNPAAAPGAATAKTP